MLIPRTILKSVPKAVSTGAGWQSMTCVELHRLPDGKAEARATDGRIASMVSWQDEPADYPGADHCDPKAVEGFRALVPGKLLAGLVRSMPKVSKGCPKPILQNVALEESSANGTVKAWATNLEESATQELRTEEGEFPAIDGVMPKGPPVATVVLDPVLLRQLLDSMAGAFDDASPAVRIEVWSGKGPQSHSDQPVVIRAESGGVSATGVIMPITG